MTKEFETFNRTKLGDMCARISTEADVNKCKEYIKQYFFHTNHGVFYHNVKESQFEYLDATSTKGGALPSFLRNGFQGKYYCQESAKLNTFKARQWFLDEYYDTYEMVMELGSKPIDHEKMTINMMGALKWDDGSTAEYVPSAKAQHGVDLMLTHIREVWCSGNEEMCEYVLNWLSCTGRRKLKTCLYLQSNEQTGKSLVIDFLMNWVFGRHLVCMTANTEVITHYTQFFEGKILCNINELPCASTGEWKKMMNKMKSLITDDTFDCRRMMQHPRSQTNTFNFIMTSNNDAVSISSTNFKRYIMLDVSNHRIGDAAYFDTLCNTSFTDEVGKAFFHWLKARYTQSGKSFNSGNPPVTKTFTDKINEKLDPVFNFIKFRIIKKNRDIDLPLKVLYREFKESKYWGDCTVERSDKKFSKLLKELKSFTVRRQVHKGSKCLFFRGTATDLFAEFTAKSWIHELDEIESGVPVVDDSEAESTDVETEDEDESDSYDGPFAQMKGL